MLLRNSVFAALASSGFALQKYWGCIGIMEKKMETGGSIGVI